MFEVDSPFQVEIARGWQRKKKKAPTFIIFHQISWNLPVKTYKHMLFPRIFCGFPQENTRSAGFFPSDLRSSLKSNDNSYGPRMSWRASRCDGNDGNETNYSDLMDFNGKITIIYRVLWGFVGFVTIKDMFNM